MRQRFLISSVCVVILTVSVPLVASAGENTFFGRRAAQRARSYSWSGEYYGATWGAPIAVVVPPTAEFQTHWGWGVGNFRVTPIDHQFSRNWPGPAQGGYLPLKPTPQWPTDTDQFGMYYIRGPW
ncbi:MAG TPA: hypothetical protein PKI05_01840 [Thermogutta sp.]|nr:hypothetical protein [Thermogutta sp.]HOP75861.1 hypothetical protein [Thermogutta sp.]HPU05080.1 hypothetical protein [Thermogutta sp.]HQF13265.1 hypothetical protein [Thermogutta sp.]